MQIHSNLDNFKAINPVVTIGTFDGVHLGHKQVIRRLQELAHQVKGETVIFTFYPHPRLVLDRENCQLRLINTLAEKIFLLEATGIDHLVIYPFTKAFSQMSYIDFVQSILVDKIKVNSLVVGYDHKFGHNRKGTFHDLKQLAKDFNFSIVQEEVLNVDAINISSTKIRTAVSQGDIATANTYLGYRFFIKGDVVNGKKMGRKIGFPTANINPQESDKLIPKDGVYAVIVDIDDKQYMGMLNIGLRPTVNNQLDNRSIEVHILNFNEDIYYRTITLRFCSYIREECCFNSLDELKKQLQKDKETVKEILSKHFD